VKVVGVGCAPGMLTEEAVRILGEARKVYGSRRAIEIARGAIPRTCEVHEIRDYSTLSIPGDAVLLSTGDPMLAGLGDRGGEIIPGISSLQLAFARLRLPLARVAVVDGHARDAPQAIASVVEEVRRGKIVFLLPDPSFPLEALARTLREEGIPCPEGPPAPLDDPCSVPRSPTLQRGPCPPEQEEMLRTSSTPRDSPGSFGSRVSLLDQGSCTIALCEDLGYPAERITTGTPDAPPAARSRLFSLVIGRF
jgi:cobalt-precorrin-7 (C5)-methyltransferase